jgi:pimeloyl-ACP methyl ester carboxylesterase
MLLILLLSFTLSSEISRFEVPLDHFDLLNQNRFSIRYKVDFEYFNPSICRIFFVLGGESEASFNNFFVKESLAKKFNAMILYSEHRFYGDSYPNSSADNFGFLNIEQSIRDNILLLQSVMDQFGKKHSSCTTITVGGSYPGNLSLLMRIKYPYLIQGAYASSAPIKYLTGEADPYGYYKTVEESIPGSCGKIVKQSLERIASMEKEQIMKILNICSSPTVRNLKKELLQAVRVHFANLNMGMYPFQMSKMKDLCDRMQNIHLNPVVTLFRDVFGVTKESECLDFGKLSPETKDNEGNVSVFCADFTGCGHGKDGRSWDFQACTEHAMEIGTDGNLVFPRYEYNKTEISEYCSKLYSVNPQFPSNTAKNSFGSSISQISKSSNLLIVNGLLDGWTSGCLRPTDGVGSETIRIIENPDGAHHSEFKQTAEESDSMAKAKKEIIEAIVGMLINSIQRSENAGDLVVNYYIK